MRQILKDEDLHEELVETVTKQLRMSMTLLMINALILAAALWDVVDHHRLSLWLLLAALVGSLRFVSAVLHRRYRRALTTRSWLHLFLIGVTFSSLVWGMSAWFLFPHGHPQHQTILIIILTGITAGGVSSLAPILSAVRIFLLLMLTPLVVQLFMQPEPVYTRLAILIILYIFMILVISKNFYADKLRTIRTRQLYDKAQRDLHLTAERFEAIFRDAPTGIFFYDADLRIIEVNQTLCETLDAPRDFLMGLDLHQIKDKGILPSLEAVLDRVDGHFEGPYVTLYRRMEIWINMRTSPVYDTEHNVIGGVGIVEDVTAQVKDQEKIRYQAYYDTLTGIPNRLYLMERVKQEMSRFRHHGIIAGVLFLDLDHFKNVNDSLGHPVGDAMLIETAGRLQTLLRDEDVVARLGGDEFVILLPDLAYTPEAAARKTEMVAQKVHTVFAEPFDVTGHRLSTTSSIGAVVTDAEHDTCEDLLKHADTAMYQAKKAGRGVTRFYQSEMDRWVQRRHKIDNALRSENLESRLQLYYQPIVDFSTGRIVGAEALLRWNDPELGPVSPTEFIAVAEENGLIMRLGSWVMEEACRRFALWEGVPYPPLGRIAVNVSSKQFADDAFVERTLTTLKRHGLRPDRLELELTESVIIDSIDATARKMEALRAHGIGLSIDDFGTGYSSLSYLKKLPFSTLKIDKSFTQDIQTDADDAALIKAIIAIAQSLELEVIAEGVETVEQFSFLKENHCHCFQGFYAFKPMDHEAFSAVLLGRGAG